MWGSFLLSFVSSSHSTPKTQLIALRFIFDPRRCRVKLRFCFVDVMTVASTILMMWWDWPSARQRSGTDEKTWLTDSVFCGSKHESVCMRVFVLGAVSLVTALDQVAGGFHLRIYLHISVCCASTMVPSQEKKQTLKNMLFASFLYFHTTFWTSCLVTLQIYCMDFCQIKRLSHVAWVRVLVTASIYRPIIQPFLVLGWVAVAMARTLLERKKVIAVLVRFSQAAF